MNTHVTRLTTSRAGSFSFPNSHAMTSQGLTYSQCYRAARVKSDWQPVTLSSIPYVLPCWWKQLEDHNIFVWSLMSVQGWGGRGLNRTSLIMLEPIDSVVQFSSEWSTFIYHCNIENIHKFHLFQHVNLVINSLSSSGIIPSIFPAAWLMCNCWTECYVKVI